jgi:hypothetical protein
VAYRPIDGKIILWRIDPLLGKHHETNETIAVPVERRDKHSSTTIELLLETALCNPLLGSCNNGNGGVFYVARAEELSGRQFGRRS